MKSTKELLAAKRQGGEWTPDEIDAFVRGVVAGTVTDAQIGAFLMAACVHQLTVSETSALTLGMAHHGASFERRLQAAPAVDKHSTGGVGDKISLLLAPLAAECGLSVPMISGRGLGHTGGTVDKLESIVGFRTDLSMSELQHLLDTEGLVMAAQSPELAPADRILYALRDVTGTVENVGLITASILSKKFAERLDGLVMDVKVGTGAFMTSLDDAHALADSLRRTSLAAGVPIRIVFTRMDHPLGTAVGNWLEMVEAERALHDRASAAADLVEITEVLTAQMVLLAFPNLSEEEARLRVTEAWTSGRAWKRFHRMVRVQGGEWEQSVERYAATPCVTLTAKQSGVVTSIDPMRVALAVLRAGGGRLVETDQIDPAAGVVFAARRGDTVSSGDVLAHVYASKARLDDCSAEIAHAIEIQPLTKTAPVQQEPSMILDIWK